MSTPQPANYLQRHPHIRLLLNSTYYAWSGNIWKGVPPLCLERHKLRHHPLSYQCSCKLPTSSPMVLLLTLQVHIAQCQPVRRFWEVQTRPKGCIDIGLWVMVTSYLNTLTDILLFLLPVPLVYKLQIHINQKLAIAVMFLAGLIPVGASIVRNVHVTQSYMDRGNWITRDTSWCVFSLSLPIPNLGSQLTSAMFAKTQSIDRPTYVPNS